MDCRSSLSVCFDDAVFDESFVWENSGLSNSDATLWSSTASSCYSLDRHSWTQPEDNSANPQPGLFASDHDSTEHTTLDAAINSPGAPQAKVENVSVLPSSTAPRELLAFASLGADGRGVLVCTLCHMAQPAWQWGRLKRHWRERNHKNQPPVTQAERDLAQEVWEKLADNALQSPEQWVPPETPIAPISHIETFSAYRCGAQDCAVRYVRYSTAHGRPPYSAWQQHLRTEHGQLEFKTIGRPAVTSAQTSREENNKEGTPWGPLVRAQRLFLTRPCHAVLDSSDADSTSDDAEPASEEAVAASWIAQFDQIADQKREQDTERGRTVAGPAAQQVDMWAKQAGFSARLQGYQYAAARRVCDSPDADDYTTELAAAAWAVAGAALRKAYEATLEAGRFARNLIARIQPSYVPLKPWTPYDTDRALGNSVRTMQACLGFFARTQLVAADAAAVPTYQLDQGTTEAWQAVERALIELHTQHRLPPPSAKGSSKVSPLTQEETLMLGLLVCLLRQQGRVNEEQELPLAVALTVLAIAPGKTTFARPNDYSGLLAGFDKMARCVVFAYARATDPSLASLPVLVEACLVRGPNHIMTWVGGIKALARHIAKETPCKGRLTWIPKNQSYLYREHQLSLRQLRAIVHHALVEQQRILCDELLFVQSLDELPSVPWDNLVDRLDHEPKGSCWTDPANQAELQAGVHWLRNHVARTQHNSFVGRGGDFVKERAVQQFKHSMLRFAEEGMPLAVWAVGMPIRGTTVTTYRWRNSDNGDELRNLVVQGGRLTLVGGHTKTTWRGTEAPMHVLPREVANLWAWYVWLVLPFWSTVRSASDDGMSCVDESFLFPNPPSQAPTSWVSRALVTASARAVEGGGFGLQPGRQLVLGFVRRFTPGDILSGGQSAQLDAPQQPISRLAAAAKACARAGATAVGRGLGDKDDDNDSDDEDSEDGDVDPGEIGASFTVTAGGQDVFTEVRNLINVRSACEIGSGHSTRTGFANYAGDAQAIPGIDELQLALWSAVSTHWHSVLRFPSTRRIQPQHKRRRVGSEGFCTRTEGVAGAEDGGSPPMAKKIRSAPPAPPAALSILGEEQVLQSLRDLLGQPSAEFRGNQWPAFNIMLNQRYGALVVVEPTGGGKTALILLPAALATARTTVVVTPFIALREQLLEQGRRADIACVAWSASTEQRLGQYLHAKIIVVAAEHLRLPSFHALMKKLHGADQIERIVVDEAHLPLVAGHWREALQHYDILATFGVPLVLLSGTLPVSDERRLLKGMRVDPADAHVLRSSTVRRNLRYSVVNIGLALAENTPGLIEGKDDNSDDWLVRYMDQYLKGFAVGRRKTMVFVHTVATAQHLATRVLDAYAFYHGVKDGPRVLLDFAHSLDGVLFCTSAAEHGIDVQDVAHVIYAFWPESITAYLQSAGRAGRDGKPATSVLLVGKSIRAFKPASLQALSDQLVVRRYAESTQCRRCFIDEYMDGNLDRWQCEARNGEELCDVCARTGDGHDEVGSGRDEVRSVVPAKPPTPPPAYEALPRENLPCGPQTQESSPFCSQDPKYNFTRLAASSSSPSPPIPAESVSFQHTALRSTSQLDPARRAESMAWRAIWGCDGAARPSPLDRIQSTLSFWKTNCRAHLLAGGDPAHTSAECHDLSDVHASIKQVAKAWNEKDFVMAPWTGCWSCKVPRHFCSGGGHCSQEWAHVVVDAWAVCLLHPASLKWIQAALKAQRLPARPDDPAVKAFLGKKIRVPSKPDRIETIPLIDMFVEMTELFFLPQCASLGSLRAYANWDVVQE